MIRLKTFGTPTLRRGDQPASLMAAHRRRIALLALLAVAGEEGMSREKLVAYLWPDADEEHARHTLVQTLYLLRHDLPGAPIVVGGDDLRLDGGAIETDVAELRTALAAGDVDAVAKLHAGPFLDGFYLHHAPEFEWWVERERARFAVEVRSVVERAARDAGARGDLQRAVQCWRRVAAIDPLDARVAVALMESLVAIGDRSGALRHARMHEAVVREELEVGVDPSVVALVARLRTTTPSSAMPARTDGRTQAPAFAAQLVASGNSKTRTRPTQWSCCLTARRYRGARHRRAPSAPEA